ncbi:MAG TPA: DNA-binding response regulator, partial [Acidaminococcaceae bacterium]|nr:DNA-binding response regulator [Acidaminococcaceae bacterium]
ETLNKVITKRLKKENYSVDSAFDGQDALELFAVAQYDVLVVDVMMPKIDGFTLVKRLRAKGDATPVLFLTARDSLDDKVTGLDAGGDDYLVKPFEFPELLARLRALLRRNHKEASNAIGVADLTMDTTTRRVCRAGQDIELTAKEYAILECLLRNAGSVLSRGQIQEHVWDFSYEGASNMIDVYINSLRRKIDKGHDVKLIQTVRGMGYTIREDDGQSGTHQK